VDLGEGEFSPLFNRREKAVEKKHRGTKEHTGASRTGN